MLKRFTKSNPEKKAVFGAPPELQGPIYFYGKIGSGKSVSMLSLAQKYHDHPERRYKIIDLYGGDRKEQNYWCFPSQDTKYWNKVKKFLRLSEGGPKQYRVHMIYPMFINTLPKKLPEHTPHVKSSIFTIPFDSITLEDLSLVTGVLSDNSTAAFNDLMGELSKKDDIADIYFKAKKTVSNKTSLWKNILDPLFDEMLFGTQKSLHKFDIEDEIKDREIITIVCLDYVPKIYHLFIMGWFLRQLNVLLDLGKIPRKNIVLMRETAEFFKATDAAIVPDRMKVFRSQLSHFVRMGRRGVHLFMDAQSPAETKGIVEGQSDLTLLGKLVSENDRFEATNVLRRDNLMTTDQISQLAFLNPGEMMFVESGKPVKKRYVFLPRTMYWKPSYGDFYSNIWTKLDNNWKQIDVYLKEINAAFIQRKKDIQQKLKEEQEERDIVLSAKEAARKEKEQDAELELMRKREIKKLQIRAELKDKSDAKKEKKKDIKIEEDIKFDGDDSDNIASDSKSIPQHIEPAQDVILDDIIF